MLKALLRSLFSTQGRRVASRHAASRPARAALIQRALENEAAGRYDVAQAAYEELLAGDADDPEVLHLQGRLLLVQSRVNDAVRALTRALALAPHDAPAWFTLGDALRRQSRFVEAAQAFGSAAAADPSLTAAWAARGDVLAALGRVDEAEDCYRRAIAGGLRLAALHHNYGNLLHRLGRIDEAIQAYRTALQLDPNLVSAASNLVYALNFLPHVTPEEVFTEHVSWASRYADPLLTGIVPHAPRGGAARTLRIGYVSPNFREHAAAWFFEPTLRHHDRDRFRIYLYSDVRKPDARTAKLRAHGDEWRDINGLGDNEVAECVRRDEIDILVDLTGHTDGHRLLVFARKPAPIQVTWNGYANTTGMRAIDYRLTDRYADPPGMTEQWHSEQLVRLPEIYMAFEPPVQCPAVTALPALTRGYVTFASFNAFAKLSLPVIEVWARVLHAVEGSRLMILTVPEGRARSRTLSAFARHGIPDTRLDLEPRRSYEGFLAAHGNVDVALDPFPFSGTTTTCHSLYMGVPVVTLAGRTHAGRVGVTMLTNAGLKELVADDEKAYVDIAAALARDLPRLRLLREGLRERIRVSPLTDGVRLARFLEQAYRAMWERYLTRHSGT